MSSKAHVGPRPEASRPGGLPGCGFTSLRSGVGGRSWLTWLTGRSCGGPGRSSLVPVDVGLAGSETDPSVEAVGRLAAGTATSGRSSSPERPGQRDGVTVERLAHAAAPGGVVDHRRPSIQARIPVGMGNTTSVIDPRIDRRRRGPPTDGMRRIRRSQRGPLSGGGADRDSWGSGGPSPPPRSASTVLQVSIRMSVDATPPGPGAIRRNRFRPPCGAVRAHRYGEPMGTWRVDGPPDGFDGDRSTAPAPC